MVALGGIEGLGAGRPLPRLHEVAVHVVERRRAVRHQPHDPALPRPRQEGVQPSRRATTGREERRHIPGGHIAQVRLQQVVGAHVGAVLRTRIGRLHRRTALPGHRVGQRILQRHRTIEAVLQRAAPVELREDDGRHGLGRARKREGVDGHHAAEGTDLHPHDLVHV